MTNRKLFFSLILYSALVASLTCLRRPDELKRIKTLPNSFLGVASKPILLAKDLDNPESPQLIDGQIVFAHSGKGEVSRVSRTGGPVEPLIAGFGFDNFADYKISAQGIAVDPATKQWIVCAAESGGHASTFAPSSFPTTAKAGRKIVLEGAVDDNPYDAVLAGGGLIIIVSGGTNKAFGGVYRPDDPMVLKPLFEVETGITGLALDPKSGDVFGAVFGSPGKSGSGSIIRFQPNLDKPSIKTVATGFTHLVDVAFTPDGSLLALEFGNFATKDKQAENNGAVSIVATDGSGTVTPFIQGLSNPSSLSVSANRDLLITEFGNLLNGQRGSLISIPLVPGRG